MRYNYDLRGFSGGGWYSRRSIGGFMEWVKETQSFSHLNDDVIRGWLKGRFEIEMFGMREKSKAYYVDVKCWKCKGRGWFGRGRPDCPECVAVGESPTRKVRRWKGGDKFTGQDKREHIWSERDIGFLDDKSIEVKYADAFNRAANHSELAYPAWINDVRVTGERGDRYLEMIKDRFTFSNPKPKVAGEIITNDGVLTRKIDTHETIIRLAMTFGCTCPITGEYIPPDQVATIKEECGYWDVYDYKYEVGYNLHSLVAPLGFSERTGISRWQPGGNRTYLNCVSPFSERGIKIICNAATKCLKALDGKIDNEWVLAEVMQSAILKRAA